jgi:hypothetical protein
MKEVRQIYSIRDSHNFKRFTDIVDSKAKKKEGSMLLKKNSNVEIIS